MAIDAEFARHARANPDAVARQYRLSPDESDQLRGLADAAASAGPTALGARLSKMGGLTSAIQSQFVLTGPDTDGDGTPDWLDNDDDNDGLPDASDPMPLVKQLSVVPVTPGPIILDQDVLDPRGDPDHDGIPNILDKKNNDPNTAGEPWGDHDNDGTPNLYDPQAPGNYAGYKMALAFSPDSDGDGIKDLVDAKDNNPDTSKEALGDNDGDGIYNYLDKIKIGPVFPGGPLVLDPGVIDPGDGDPPPPPPSGDPTPPPPVGEIGAETPAGETPADPGQQPVMLAGDAVGQPIIAPPESQGGENDGGIPTSALIVGGAALAGGVVVGGIAAKVLANKSQEEA